METYTILLQTNLLTPNIYFRKNSNEPFKHLVPCEIPIFLSHMTKYSLHMYQICTNILKQNLSLSIAHMITYFPIDFLKIFETTYIIMTNIKFK